MEKQLINTSEVSKTVGKTQTIGYKRVSTIDQNPDNQLPGFVLDKVFIDYVSGKTIERPALKEMLAYVRDGDNIIVHAMDRLARNTQDLLQMVSYLNRNNISIRFVVENLTFDGSHNPIAKCMLTMMGAIAEFELSLMQERQKEAVQRAKREGKYKGRPKNAFKLSPDQINYIKRSLSMGVPQMKLVRELNVTRTTIRNYMKQLNDDQLP